MRDTPSFTPPGDMSSGLPHAARPLRGGVFVGVCGPSGAGKDSVMNYARERLDDVRGVSWVRRVITRPSDRSSEDHDTMDEAAFAAAEARHAFALAWNAHGLRYGLPASVDHAIGSGKVAVANISRAVLPALRARYANVTVAHITASPEILADRLAVRGRESRDEILARLKRMPVARDKLDGAVEIDNSGSLREAGERFVELVSKALGRAG